MAEEEKKEVTTDEEITVVTVGEDTPPQDKEAPQWVKEVRQSNRDLKKQVRALEAKLKSGTENNPVAPGEKPTYKSCEFDEDKLDQALTSWHEKKNKFDRQTAKLETDKKTETENWNKKLDDYGEKKTALFSKLKNFDEFESVTRDTLSETQTGLIVEIAENSPLVVYALGANPELLEKFSKISSHPLFIKEIVKLEATLKMETKKTAVAPEKKVEGSGNVSNTTDSELKKLYEEADKTGDRSKIHEYLKKQRAAG